MFKRLEICEMPGFSEAVIRLLSDFEYSALQRTLMVDPEKGDLIPHSGGARKIRVAMSGRGKRGGGRVVYYYHVANAIHFLFIYPKNEQENLSTGQLRWAKSVIEQIKKGDL